MVQASELNFYFFYPPAHMAGQTFGSLRAGPEIQRVQEGLVRDIVTASYLDRMFDLMFCAYLSYVLLLLQGVHMDKSGVLVEAV